MSSIPVPKCDFCRKDVSNEIHVACAQCQDLNLCLECFAAGVEQRDHRNFHDYRIVDNMKFSVFEDEWDADEELLLLDALEQYGLGNWREVASKLPKKTPKECERHYLETYVKYSEEDVAVEEDATEFQIPAPGKPTENAGYYPRRGDFEHEYLDSAEEGIKDLVFYEDDDDQDKRLKLAMVDIYNRRLERRVKRRKIVHDYDILNPNYSAKQKQLLDILKPFVRHESPEEHKKIMENAKAIEDLHRRRKILIEELKSFEE